MAKKKKNSVDVKLISGNKKISKSSEPDVESYNKLLKEGSETENSVRPAVIISRVDHPVDVKYGDRTIRVSPRAQLEVADISKLGETKNGIYIKRLPKRK